MSIFISKIPLIATSIIGFGILCGKSILSALSKSSELATTDDLCKKIIEINDADIISSNFIFSRFINCNIGSTNPTGCGTVANAMFYMIPEILGSKLNFENDLKHESLLSKIFIKKIKEFDSDTHRYVYKPGCLASTLYNPLTSNTDSFP